MLFFKNKNINVLNSFIHCISSATKFVLCAIWSFFVFNIILVLGIIILDFIRFFLETFFFFNIPGDFFLLKEKKNFSELKSYFAFLLWLYQCPIYFFVNLGKIFYSYLFFFFNFFIELSYGLFQNVFFNLYTYNFFEEYLLFFLENFLYFFLLYFFSNIFSLFLSSYIGLYGVFFFNLFTLFFFWKSICVVFVYFLKFNRNINIVIDLGTWLNISIQKKINFLLVIDSLSLTFILLTSSIALAAYVYAFVYFRGEPHVDRLLIFLNLFVLSMILMVSGGNFIILFLGWELIGITSFFLINFWNTRVGTLKSAFKAFLFNRISDVALLYLCVFVYSYFNTTEIRCVLHNFRLNPNLMYNGYNYINVFSIVIIIPIFIKSAQLFSHIWLPDSMEAPVPASALIHSATLVSAGIYLILRFKIILILSYYFVIFVPVVGSLTALYGAVVSFYQTDAKKILAYSTISHCGFLVVSAVLCDIEYTLFYLLVHGFFKAASFICVGNVIRFNNGLQDIRVSGALYKYMQFECFALFISLLYLAGVPLSLGFFMKHFILENLAQQKIFYNFIITICSLASFFGIGYSFNLYVNVFFSYKRGSKFLYKSYSRKQLDISNFYTTTTTLARISITGLIIFGIIFSYIYFFFFTVKGFHFGNFDFNSISKYKYVNMFVTLLPAVFNLYYINLLALFSIFFLVLIFFVRIFRPDYVYFTTALFIFILILFLLVICI